jgi:1,4-dihydroxy-2-naphthoate octaprenyltransferase
MAKENIHSTFQELYMKAFFQSLRVPFVSVTLTGVLLGTATAYYTTGAINSTTSIIVLLVTVCGHISANLFNDYFDHCSGNDRVNENVTPLSGGSRAIQECGVKPITILLTAVCFLLVSFIAGGLFIWLQQNINFLYFGVAGLFFGFAYTAPPLKLVYRGCGELVIILTFGLFIVGGAYFAQTGIIDIPAIFVLFPAGFLTANILLINTFPDYAADKAVNKRTFVVRFGKENGKRFAKNLVTGSYLFIVAGVVFGFLPVLALLSFISLPIAYDFFKKIERIEEDFLPVGVLAIKIQIVFTVLASLGIIIVTLA